MTTTNDQTELIRNRLDIPKQQITKLDPAARVAHFDEIYESVDLDVAMVEAARCIDCPSAPCMEA